MSALPVQITGREPVPALANPLTDWFTTNAGSFISGLIDIVVIVAVAFALRVITGKVITQVTKRMVSGGERLAKVTTGAANRIVKSPRSTAQRRQAQRADTIASVLRSVASFVIFLVAFITVLGELGINIGPILASAGVIGLAIGFGAQSLVQDFLAGLFMMTEDQYGVGDVIDVGDAVGTVEAVTLRLTKVRDLNGGLWHVRNGEIRRVCNMNQDWANAVVEMPLHYSVDVEQATASIQRSIDEFTDNPANAQKMLDRPDISGVVGVDNGAVTIRVLVTTKPGEQWGLGRELRGQLKTGFDRDGITIAHPLPPLAGAAAREG